MQVSVKQVYRQSLSKLNCLDVHQNGWLIVYFQQNIIKYIVNIQYIGFTCFQYSNTSGWGESVRRSAGEMGWRWISWPGRLTNSWWSRCIWTSPDGATASASQAASCGAEESLAEEESGSAQSLPQLLQSTWGQGWRSDVCQDGTALPAAGITASMSLHPHNMLVDFILCSQATGWLIVFSHIWLVVCPQEMTVKQLQSPLPLPTTLPLLSASIAPTKTVIANPVLHLGNHIHDILYTVVQMEAPPHPDIVDDRVRHTQTHTH